MMDSVASGGRMLLALRREILNLFPGISYGRLLASFKSMITIMEPLRGNWT